MKVVSCSQIKRINLSNGTSFSLVQGGCRLTVTCSFSIRSKLKEVNLLKGQYAIKFYTLRTIIISKIIMCGIAFHYPIPILVKAHEIVETGDFKAIGTDLKHARKARSPSSKSDLLWDVCNVLRQFIIIRWMLTFDGNRLSSPWNNNYAWLSMSAARDHNTQMI